MAYLPKPTRRRVAFADVPAESKLIRALDPGRVTLKSALEIENAQLLQDNQLLAAKLQKCQAKIREYLNAVERAEIRASMLEHELAQYGK